MRQLRQLWRSFFDVRPGERLRVLFMSLYLLFVLFAYYILKPVSRALFLNKFDIDKLPWLYVLIAAVGGVFAYVYTRVAVGASLKTAVAGASAFSAGFLVLLWAVIRTTDSAWIYYVFNIWVSLFSIILVSQGWLVAANVFSSREAKRVYGILGVGSVFGAAFGGSFTAFTVKIVGVNNLLLASAFMVALSYLAFLAVAAQKDVALSKAKAAGDEEASFAFGDIVSAIRAYRHLQVIIGIISLTYIVDVLVEYQFSAAAKEAYATKEQLTAFLGSFYGLWLNLLTFVLQFFLTAAVVNRFGVGGTLQIMPISIAAASLGTLFAPGVISTACARLTEAATRYSFNRTGMELLYLPLPAELKNRTKAFVDIFVDRLSRGMGGMLLVLLTTILPLEARHISVVAIIFSIAWIALSVRARNEYIATVRKRLESRRLDLESARVSVNDPAMVKLLEDAARGPNKRQATYALTLLGEAAGYPLKNLLLELGDSPSQEVRAKVFEIALKLGAPELIEQTLKEIRSWRRGEQSVAMRPAVEYAMAMEEDPEALARRLLEHPNEQAQESVIESLHQRPELAQKLLSREWLESASATSDPRRRRLAALAAYAQPDHGILVLDRLLRDPDDLVVEAACRAAGRLKNRAHVDALTQHLADPRLRGVAIDALAAYGTRIIGSLSDVLNDPETPSPVRRQIPRVLQRIPDQRCVNSLLPMIAEPDLALRSPVLRALGQLRESAPKLNYGAESVTQQILNEAKSYYELTAALHPFRKNNRGEVAGRMLTRTLEERLQATVERLFRLLGLRYPPGEIHAAYLAVNRGGAEGLSTAIEFLDNVLDRDLKRILLPLFDAPDSLVERGRELFGLRTLDVESALRELMQSGDEWLVCCAMAVAGEMKARNLAPDVARLSQSAGREAGLVGRSVIAALAG